GNKILAEVCEPSPSAGCSKRPNSSCLPIRRTCSLRADWSLWLLLLHNHPMGICVGVVANARHLPGDLQPGSPTGDDEAVVMDFPRDIDGRRPTDTGELVPEILIESLKIGG